ncbi:Ccc1 family [Umbelopsis sp. PMI_123]|nr:Ccc1 family [Umbelopsis sp. PMI_123]
MRASSSIEEEELGIALDDKGLLQEPRRRHHREDHFEQPELVRDCILGLSDGLTVPFALAAGLSSLDNTKIVIYGGVAELVSGALSMALGGYLAARSEMEHYKNERRREERELDLYPEEEEDEIVELFESYGMDRASLEPMLAKLRESPERAVDFHMRFELNLEKPDPNRSWMSAVTIGSSYFVGGLIPLIPYFFYEKARPALYMSVLITSLTLLIFGYVKSMYLTPRQAVIGALQTLAIGAAAAASSYLMVYLFSYDAELETPPPA